MHHDGACILFSDNVGWGRDGVTLEHEDASILDNPHPSESRAASSDGSEAASDAGSPYASDDDIVGGSAIALLWLLSSDLRATKCGAPSKPQPTTWNGRSGIWRHNYTVWMACPTAKTTRINLTRPSPRLVYHCNDAISRIQEGPRPLCTQARSLSARNGEDSSRPASAVYHSNRAGEFCL